MYGLELLFLLYYHVNVYRLAIGSVGGDIDTVWDNKGFHWLSSISSLNVPKRVEVEGCSLIFLAGSVSNV